MGTSANLLIKSAGKRCMQHTSYDGSPSNVFACIGATLAAAGVEPLRAAIARAVVVEDDGDMEQTGGISMQVAAEAYLLACQARGHEPILLLSTLMDPFGLRDFAHGGAISMFGNPLIHEAGFGSRDQDADFVLDLDAGTLQAMVYENHDAQSTVAGWTLPLDRLEGLSPDRVFEVLIQLDFEAEDPASAREAMMNKALVDMTEPSTEDPSALHMPRPLDWSSSSPVCHQFLAHADNAVSLRMLIGILQRCAKHAPALAEPGVLLAQMTPNANHEVSLSIDLRQHPEAGVDELFNRFSEMADRAGLLYRCSGGGMFRSMGGGMMVTSVGCGDDFPEDDALFSGFGQAKVQPPSDAVPVRTQQTRLADIAEDAASMSPEAVGYLAVEKMMARANFDGEILDRIPEAITLSAEQVRTSNILINLMGHWEDVALPGERRARFDALPATTQEEILNSFKPVGRFVFTQMLDLPATPSAPRRPSP